MITAYICNLCRGNWRPRSDWTCWTSWF